LPTLTVADRPEDIPVIYAAVQRAFDASSTLAAFTQNGEERQVTTRAGAFRASTLSRIDWSKLLEQPSSTIGAGHRRRR
jgi:hypothetical protein